MNSIYWFCIVLIFAFVSGLSAQATAPRPPRADLPFEVSEKKRLSEKDAEKKREGSFISGLPLINSDPNTGIGYGVRVIYTINGERNRPLFEYTPYKYQVFAQYFNTTKNAPYHWARLDAPYIFDTQFRLRADLIYDRNPQSLYFGYGEKTLDNLSYKDRESFGQPTVQNARFDEYEEALSVRRPGVGTEPGMVTDKKYNRYDLENPTMSSSLERSFFGGTVRAVGGLRFSKQTIRTFDGKPFDATGPLFPDNGIPVELLPSAFASTPNGTTKLTQDSQSNIIRGLNGGFVNTLRLGMVYDTRDFEPDPNSGMFLEYTHERATKALGSNYEYNKNYVSARFFWSPFKDMGVEKLVFAGRAAFIQTNGDAPFYEYRNMWSTDGNLAGLGGRTTIRGYKQDRFIGPNMGFANLEVRWKFGEIVTGGQHFAFQLVPFYDLGRVWDKISNVGTVDYKHSKGLGLRIPWNLSTIIYIDHAWSNEDRQTFVNFFHIF
jgi:hypothetical protein